MRPFLLMLLGMGASAYASPAIIPSTSSQEAAARAPVANIQELTVTRMVDGTEQTFQIYNITDTPSSQTSSLNSRDDTEPSGQIPVALELLASIYSINTTSGVQAYTIPADRDSLLTFLQGAATYAYTINSTMGTAYDPTQKFFQYSNGSYTMTMIIKDFTLFEGGKSPGWNFFGRAATGLYNVTTKYSGINSTWVGVIQRTSDGLDSKNPVADVLITEGFKSVTLPSGTTFPAANNSANDNSTDLSAPNVPPSAVGAGEASTAVPDISVVETTTAASLNAGLPSANNGRLKTRALSKRAGPYGIGSSGYYYTVFQSTRASIMQQALVPLIHNALTLLVADNGDSSTNYAQFDAPFPQVFNVPADFANLWQNVRFQFQAVGASQIPRDVMVGFVQRLVDFTAGYLGRNPIHGQIVDENGIVHGSWALGALLETISYIPFQTVSGCIVQHPDGTVGACIFRDEL